MHKTYSLLWLGLLVLAVVAWFLEIYYSWTTDLIDIFILLAVLFKLRHKPELFTTRPLFRVLAGIIGVVFFLGAIFGVKMRVFSYYHIIEYIIVLTIVFFLFNLAIKGYIFKIEK